MYISNFLWHNVYTLTQHRNNQMKVNISIEWHGADSHGDHADELLDHGVKEVSQAIREGFTEGELYHYSDDEIETTGYWHLHR